MRRSERTLLLLCGALDDGLLPLTPREYRTLRLRVTQSDFSAESRLSEHLLRSLGYAAESAERIAVLLERQAALDVFLARAAQNGVSVLTRLSKEFPERLRRLGDECPALLFFRGELQALNAPCVSLVGSRALRPQNRCFAEAIGNLAAQEGCTLVSGGAAGADRAAQDACLAGGGQVVCIVPDELIRHTPQKNVLFCSDEGWHSSFSTVRALRRNHLIHALGEKTFVAQSDLHIGGTWSGTQDNLRRGLSPVFVFQDGSAAAAELARLGAELLPQAPDSLTTLRAPQLSIFDEL